MDWLCSISIAHDDTDITGCRHGSSQPRETEPGQDAICLGFLRAAHSSPSGVVVAGLPLRHSGNDLELERELQNITNPVGLLTLFFPGSGYKYSTPEMWVLPLYRVECLAAASRCDPSSIAWSSRRETS